MGAAHEAFLQRLAAARGEEIAGEEIVERTAARWRATAPGVSSEWRALGDEALRRAHVELRGGRVACGIAHGDFAPWNTRDAGSERLFVYDWEAAAWEAPLGWDMFHFQVQVASLLGGRAWRPPARRERALFWLYLLDSACLGIAEQSAACRGVEFRRQLLRAELSHP